MVDFDSKPAYDVGDFRRIIELLRAPGGCPWDREQTHESVRRNLLEEAYEVCEAIDQQDPEHLKEELGDLLMQVLFHARMEEEKGVFSLDDVADAACKKLIYRHPHVFGTASVSGSEEVLKNWDELKRREKSQTTASKAMEDVARSLPALWRAEKIQKKAKKAGFDWPEVSGATDKLSEELEELRSAMEEGDPLHIQEELGDLMFTIVNIARFVDVDPEKALHASCDKFVSRYAGMEELARERGLDLEKLSLEEQEELYQQAKAKE